MVQVVEQGLSRNGKANDWVVVQSTRLDISAVPIWCWSPGGFLRSCLSAVYIGILKK